MARGGDRREVVWNLVPPGSPPSATGLHSQANNRPAALLRTLEPPRGLHYFPMERFRQSWHRSPTNGGFRRFSGGGGGSDGSMNADDLRVLPSKGRHSPSDPFNTPSVAGGRGATVGAGMASFSPAGSAPPPGAGKPYAQSGVGGGRSSPGSSTVTPIQQGFSMFGGKAFSTPASGDRPRPPLDFSTQVDGTPVGSNGPRQGGISRFKTLTQRTTQQQEEEEEEDDEEETKDRRSRRRHAARALLSPSAELSQHTSIIGSPPIPSQVASPPSFGGPIGGLFGHGYSTPAPVDPSSSTTAGGDATAMTMTEPSDRKRSRQPNATSTSTNSRTTAPLVPAERASATRKPPMGDAQRDAPAYASQARQERAWGSISRGGAQHQEHKSPRVTATRGGTGVAGGMPKSSSRSPRAKTKSPSRSPRAARGGSSQHASQGPTPPPRRYTLADFAGADEVCFNAGASPEALAVFLERCEARGTVALCLLWADLTTSYSAVTVKSCLPSQRCHRWNCACGRQPRAHQATAPLIGAIVYLPAEGEGLPQGRQKGADGSTDGVSVEEAEFPEAETYLLPLGACHGEDQQATEREGYRLPIKCQATYDERWRALAKLVAMPARKVAFNAQVTLMPLIAWSRRPDSATAWSLTSPSDADRSGSAPRTVSSLFDPRVAAWVSDTGSTDKALEFEALCITWLKDSSDSSARKERKATIDSSSTRADGGVAGKRKSAIAAAVLHAEGCCRRSLNLAAKLSEELEGANMLAACEEVEMPAIPVLASMEVSGVVFLPERVTRFSEGLERHLDRLRRRAVATVGGKEFNLASPDQVADILFKHLKLPSPPLKAGSVHASTSAEVLEGLLGKHAVIDPVLEFRGVNKYKTTYVDKLAEKALGAAPADSNAAPSQGSEAVRIHAAWNQTSVRTGRLSCSRPNLQQIPKSSDPLAGVADVNVRDAFVASKSFTLMAADYSQIEMRVLADACRDPGLASLFASVGGSGGDVYRRLAAQVFGKEEGIVTDPERTRAKVVCLGVIYGMGIPQVARKLEVTESQAQGLVRSFLRAFPGIEPFLAATRRYARGKGFVCTLTGRRRHLPQINNSHSAVLKAQAERQAVNSVVQGTAADIIKTAMVLVARKLDEWRSSLEEGLECPRLIMQIHDELVLECPACEEDLERLKGLLIECMEVEAPAMLGIKCPLTVNMLVGMAWGSMRKVVSQNR